MMRLFFDLKKDLNDFGKVNFKLSSWYKAGILKFMEVSTIAGLAQGICTDC
jgi:hypothetical protein